MKIQSKFWDFKISWKIVIPVVLIVILGLVSLLSTTINPEGHLEIRGIFLKQVIFVTIGAFLYLVVSKVDYKYYKFLQVTAPLHFFVIILLVLTMLFGPVVKSSKRWLPILGFQIQPSEIAKVSIILLTSSIMILRRNKWFLAVISLVPTVLTSFLIYIQPHGSMALIILVLWGIVVFTVLDHQLRNALIITVLVISFFVFLNLNYKNDWGVVDSLPLYNHQKERIENFFNPEDSEDIGFNVEQSKVAIGSGKLFGKGFGQGTQSKLRFLPEHQTDFLFASYAEEFGLVGTFLLVALYLFLLVAIFSVNFKLKDNFASLLVTAFSMKFLLEVFINIGTNTGLTPATGIPLPLFSAGGSITVMTFIVLGVVQNIMFSAKEDFLWD